VADYPIFDFVKDRKNVILLGDGIDDIGMIEGFDYDNLLKIGFLNEEPDKYIDAFKRNFDLIILDNGGMDPVNKIIAQI
jgi:5'-nucleotidase